MNISKKAMSVGFLVTMVITIVAFMFIAGTIFRFMSKAEDKQAEVLCRDSVALKAATTINIEGVEAKVAPVLCKTLDKKVSDTREEVKKEIADKIARCWWMFNEGRYKTDVFDNINIFGGETNCFVCYTILVEESRTFGSKHPPITSGEFGDFLSGTKYHSYNGTYLDYIQHSGGDGAFLGVLSDKGVQPNRAYAIAYQAKASKCPYCIESIFGGSALLSTGVVTLLLITPGVNVVTVAAGASVVGGALLTGYSSGRSLREEGLAGKDIETKLDTIIFTDISNEASFATLAKSCNFIEDIAGN